MTDKAKKKARCPGCNAALTEAYAEASYGRVVLVDQCPRCGGVWFDRWELYFLGPDSLEGLAAAGGGGHAQGHAPGRVIGAAAGALSGVPVIEGIATLDPAKFLSINTAGRGDGPCPRCGRLLKEFTDPALPKDASIKRCAECRGLWLNRGELERYAAHRREKGARESSMTAVAGPKHGGQGGQSGVAAGADAPVPEAQPVAPAERMETLRNLQKELDTRGIAERVEAYDQSLADEPMNGREFATDVGFIILQALLRLVFKV